MKLIYSHASPYARAARVFAREAGLIEHIEEMFLHPFENPQALIDANPLCKVPCLIIEKEQAIFDSQVICEYLEEKGQSTLFTAFSDNWHLKTLYSLTRGLLDSAVAWQQDKMREELQRSAFWQQRFRLSIDRGLAYLQQSVSDFPQDFSALHINTLVLLDYMSFRHPEYQWQDAFPKLMSWSLIYKDRTSMLDTIPKG